MRSGEVLRSLTFRYIVKYVTVLSACVFVAMAAFYAWFSYNLFRELGESVLDEVQTLQLIYRGQSLDGVGQYMADQAAIPSVDRFYYLATDAQGRKVAGDLPADSRYEELEDGWLEFELALQDWGGAVDVEFLARPVELGDGYRAIVAREYAEIVDSGRIVLSSLVRAMTATILLGVIGGYFSAARTLNRIERLNRDVSRIIRSNPTERLDLEGENGYVRGLGQVMNQMLEQMEFLMQGVRRVSDNIAHDLRTPLTRMRNDLSQLQAGGTGAGGAQLERIIEECDELLAAFNASLQISTLESGSRLAGGPRVGLRAVLQDVVELYEPLAQEGDVALSMAAGPEIYCAGEVDLLFQMFANVIDNAVKYTPGGGRITVSVVPGQAGEDDVRHSVIVGDSGPGVPVVERKNVFRRYYRVESSRGEHPGHGLGLSLVQAIAQYHHGSVELGNNNPGLRVKIRLPAWRETA